MTGWTEADSFALDREIKALRQADERERSTRPSRKALNSLRSDEDVQRRKRVRQAMRKRERREVEKAQARAEREANQGERSATYKANRSKRPGRVRWPKPRQKPNGRWLARCTEGGVQRQKTFSTEAEAQAWLDQMINPNTEED